ncbi:hypothetical protein B4119_0916 [Parageobacillus caldoxylosilyticus]|uniref:Uncharacterized protein n=1 Tax=Saccharococcus caldoxylosilyticus TaxID=81408 RepID=A0A150LGT1_9BACL|nr:hypothetical protein B4119_0916 [Parageobacillus caldoxylosilyticus]
MMKRNIKTMSLHIYCRHNAYVHQLVIKEKLIGRELLFPINQIYNGSIEV